MKQKPLSENFKKEKERAVGYPEIWSAVQRLEVDVKNAVKKLKARRTNQLRIHWNWLKNKPYEEVVLFLNAIDDKIMGKFVISQQDEKDNSVLKQEDKPLKKGDEK